MNAILLLRCRVVLGFWGGPDSEIALHNAVDALMGALSPDDKDERLKVTYLSGRRARDLLGFAFRLESRGLSTDLLPAEAVPYFEIPTIELGIRHSSPASFSLAAAANHGAEFKPFLTELMENTSWKRILKTWQTFRPQESQVKGYGMLIRQ